MSSHSHRQPSHDAWRAHFWGSEPRASSLPRAGPYRVIGLLALLLVNACAAGSSPATPPSGSAPAATDPPSASAPSVSPSDAATPSQPADSPSDTRAPGAPAPPIDSPEEAAAAVAAVDQRFLGYQPRDINLIGQANYVVVTGGGEQYTLVFTSGSGDCPAGCINKEHAKFVVTRDGQVEKRCEWAEGEVVEGTPC